MARNVEIIKFAQLQMGLKPDGIIGAKTALGVERVLKKFPAIKRTWLVQRKLFGFVQSLAKQQGINPGAIDGLIGPQSLVAFENLLYLKEHGELLPAWRNEVDEKIHFEATHRSVNPHDFPKYIQMRGYFGQPGSKLVTIALPYKMRLSWDKNTVVSRLTCSKYVASSLTGVLETIRDFHGISGIEDLRLNLFGGCYNNRKMRGGSKLSTHAWGAAIDLDPERNQLRWDSTQASFAQPEYQFMRDAFAAEGWVSLGEAKDYDWMHFQAVRL